MAYYSQQNFEEHNQAITDWTKKHKLEWVTRTQFEIFQLSSLEPGAFRVVLDYFKQKECQDLLSKWGDSPYTYQLHRFSLCAEELLKTKLFPFPAGLKETIEKQRSRYHLLLLLRGNADASLTDLRQNLHHLKLWLITKAIEASDQNQNLIFEQNTIELSRFFAFDNNKTRAQRMALCDKALHSLTQKFDEWTPDFDNFSAQITQTFVHTFNASGITGREDKSKFFRKLYLRSFVQATTQAVAKISHERSPNNATWKALKPWAKDDFTENLSDSSEQQTQTNEELLPEYQTLSSKTILYTTSEQACYLPWSHFKPSPNEIKLLESTLSTPLSNDPIASLGMTLIYIGLKLGRTPSRVEDMLISDDLTKEWALSPTNQKFRRLRPANEYLKTTLPENADLPLKNVEDTISIELPTRFRSTLLELSRNSAGKRIGELWQSQSKQSLDNWFNKNISTIEGLSRLQPSMLQYVAEQQIYQQTKSNTLSRILTYHPYQQLPSLTSYNSWSAKEVRSLDLGYTITDVDDDQLLFGSAQNIDEEIVAEKIQNATKKLGRKYDKIFEYHNDYSLYCMIAICAATGARPVRDPFERIEHFNLEEGIIFINDKSDGHRRDGRIVTMPTQAQKITQHYISHLSELADTLREINSDLSEAINSLVTPAQNKPFGLFFLLNEDLSVSPIETKHFSTESPLSWDMPKNFFRHRFSKKFLKAGCDEEVIEGITGHADLGISSYSPTSSRCIESDLDDLRAISNDVFSALGFKAIKSKIGTINETHSPQQLSNKLPTGKFGIARRKQNRQKTIKAANLSAKVLIDCFLENQEASAIGGLDQKDFKALQSSLLQGAKGQPHHQAGIRFQYLIQRCKDEESKSSHHLRLTQRIDSYPLEPSCFSEHTPSDIEKYKVMHVHLMDALESNREDIAKASTKNYSESLYTFVFLLIVETRISSKEIIKRALSLDNVKLILLYDRYYVEFTDPDNEELTGRPVQRHKISFLCARYLNRVLLSKSKIKAKPIPHLLRALSGIQLPIDVKVETQNQQFFANLTRIVRNYNYYSLPGYLAASLDGDPLPTSLPWAEWVRVQHRKHLVPINTSPPKGISLTENKKYRTSALSLEEKTSNAFDLADKILQSIKAYRPVLNDTFIEGSENALAKQKGQISSFSYIFFQWFIEYCRAGKKHNGNPFARKSLQTTMSLLYRPVITLLGSKELHAMDSAQLNEQIADIIDSRDGSAKSQWQFILYFKDFLSWSARHYPLPQVDWALLELEDDNYRHVSSGLIFEDEYLTILELLVSSTDELADKAAVISILTYRFGLRFSEGAFLRRSDCFFDVETPYVHVKEYYKRTLKRPNSNRMVPALFELTEMELRILKRSIALFDNDGTSPSKATPLLFKNISKNSLETKLSRISTLIKDALVLATQRDYLSEHHLRHTFLSKLALVCSDKPLRRNNCFGELNPQKVRKVLLGDEEYRGLRETRSLSRAMGHSYPKQTYKSYCHLTSIWSDELIKDYRVQQTKPLESAIDILKHLESKSRVKSIEKKTLTLNEQLKRTLTLLNSLGHGGALAETAQQLELDLDKSEHLLQALKLISAKRFPKSEEPFKDYLNSIRPAAWASMIGFAENAPIDDLIDLEFELSSFINRVSLRGHIFGKTENEITSIVSLLKFLEIEPGQVKIYPAKAFNLDASTLLGEYASSIDEKIQQDPFKFRNTVGDPVAPDTHLGFVMQRTKGIIRNSFALSVMISVLASLRSAT